MMKKNIDISNMKEVIAQSPAQLEKGLTLASHAALNGDFENVIICAMGGSALPADLIVSLNEPNIPLYIHRDYGLPAIANNKSLVICISYSGNTEETVSAAETALKSGMSVIGMASGGMIEQLTKEHNVPFVKIPSGIQPRSAIGYLFSALATILANENVIADISTQIKQAAHAIEDMNETLEKQGQDLAKKILPAIPIIYSTQAFGAVARIWKIKFNENSKIPSFYNIFPELNHNEMVGFSQSAQEHRFCFLLIKDAKEHPRNAKRMDLFAKLTEKLGSASHVINVPEGSILTKIFSLLLLGDWTSYYLAIEQNIDPTPVAMVEEFKRLMQD